MMVPRYMCTICVLDSHLTDTEDPGDLTLHYLGGRVTLSWILTDSIGFRRSS